MVRLKHANDEKSTTGGRKFHTFITLSAKKFLSAVFVVFGLYHLTHYWIATAEGDDGGGIVIRWTILEKLN